jgi:hypothetical protein
MQYVWGNQGSHGGGYASVWSSGLYNSVVRRKRDVSGERIAYIFDPEDRDDTFLRNVTLSPNYMALQRRRPYPSKQAVFRPKAFWFLILKSDLNVMGGWARMHLAEV